MIQTKNLQSYKSISTVHFFLLAKLLSSDQIFLSLLCNPMLSFHHLRLSSPFPYHYQRSKTLPIRAEGSISASPPGKSGTKRRSSAGKGGDAAAVAEAAAVVRQLLRRTGGGKETLISVLNKNVKVIRKDHCFLLFEELGKKEGWLQCLEVLIFLFSFFFFNFVNFAVL